MTSIGGDNSLRRHHQHANKDRSQSDSPQKSSSNTFLDGPMQPDGHIISSADIYSWKLKKEYDGSVYAVYCIHVALRSGFKWIVERRYSQFRELRKEINKVRPDLHKLSFPKKNWMFNLTKSSLKGRQSLLNSFLSELVALTPQLLELAIFLEVELRLTSERSEAKNSSLRRTLSFGSLNQALTIKDFQLIKVLGKGSFGKVFLVRPMSAPQSEVYAMKVLRKNDVVKRHQVEHTLTERYILATIRHPFILSLRHAFQTPEKLYMVTDYCPGGELFFHLKRLRRFTEGMMRFYCAQISVALAHLHQHDIVYRDLKPENVLLDAQGHIKLTDFGLSKRLKSDHARSSSQNIELTFCGTPEYLSPEMILHRKNSSGYGKNVDWWSLGIVCFELLTGWPPFYDRDFHRMCEKILYRPLNFPTQKYNLSRGAEDLLRSFLQRDPSKRIHFQLNQVENSTGKDKCCLQQHPFFEDMDWDKLVRCAVEPPLVPLRPRDISDTCNFDKEFTKLSIKDSPDNSLSERTLSSADKNNKKDPFIGFSFSLENGTLISEST